MKSFDIGEILNRLPHRYPFLLIDKVLDYEIWTRIEAVKNVTINEPFFQGHFPGKPLMPGVLIIEAMAQAGAILSYVSEGKGNDEALVYFAGIDEARFRKPVVPGDQLYITVLVEKRRGGLWKLNCTAKVDDEAVAEATLLATIRAMEQ